MIRDWIIHSFAADAMGRGVKQGGGGFAQVKRFSDILMRLPDEDTSGERTFPRPKPPEGLTVENLWSAISPYLLESSSWDRIDDYMLSVGDSVFRLDKLKLDHVSRIMDLVDVAYYKIDGSDISYRITSAPTLMVVTPLREESDSKKLD